MIPIMETYRFKAKALTPIFIGSGCEIDPTQYVLKDNLLIRFNVSDVLSGLPENETARFNQHLERADLKEIQNFLTHHLDDRHHALARLEVSKGFAKEFSTKSFNPNNQFRVDMMPRNPHTGQAVIPGSAIKGAIRTAVVDHFANCVPELKTLVHQAVTSENNPKKKGQMLEETALGRRHSQTERDVFRLIHVRDATLPDGSTRIDRAANINPGKMGAESIQMWVERLKSVADDPHCPEFDLTMQINASAMHHERIKSGLGRTLDFETLLAACNRFFWGRMLAEANRFDGRESRGSSWQKISEVFPKGRTEAGEIVTIDPSTEFWAGREYATRRILLRVGHFSHFESLSVNELRQGWNIKKNQPIKDMGSTRTRCLMENGKPPMPFGWLMLSWVNP